MPVKKENAPISAFERKRLENIEANKAILTDISHTAKRVIPAAPKPKPAPSKKRTRNEPVKRESTRPTRISSRLAGIESTDEVRKRKLEIDAEVEVNIAKAKKLRVNGDLELGDIVVEGKKWGSGLDGLKGIIRGAEPGIRTFTEDDVQETTDKGLKDLRVRMGGLQLYEEWAPNGTLPWFTLHIYDRLLNKIQISKSPLNACTPSAFTPPRTSRSFLLGTKRALWACSTDPRRCPSSTTRTRPRQFPRSPF